MKKHVEKSHRQGKRDEKLAVTGADQTGSICVHDLDLMSLFDRRGDLSEIISQMFTKVYAVG